MDNAALLKHLFSLVIFGTNGTLSRFIHLSSCGIVFYRTILASLVLFAFFKLSGNKFTFPSYRYDLKFILFSGLAQSTEWFLMYESYRHIDVGVATLLTYCGPVIVIALSPIVFKEKLTVKKLAYLAVVLVGVVFLNRGVGGHGNIKFGLLCAGSSAFCYAAMVICNKQAEHISGFENAVLQLFFCCCFSIVFTLLKTGFRPPLPEPVISQWLLVLLLGTTNTGLTCYLYFSTLGKLPAQVIAVSGYLEPLLAIVYSSLLLGERMTALQLLGCAMIIGGAARCILEGKKA